MGAIDIGAAATNRSSYNEGNTLISVENPANGTGTITSVEIWANSNMTAAEAATFIDEGSVVFSTRDTEALGSVTAGSKQTFSGLDMDVTTGDYLGWCASAGRIERDNTGDGTWYASGDNIPASSVQFGLSADRTMSLYGIGATAVVPGIGAYSRILNPWGVNKYGARIG